MARADLEQEEGPMEPIKAVVLQEIKDLKALAYDLIAEKEQIERQLHATNTQIKEKAIELRSYKR